VVNDDEEKLNFPHLRTKRFATSEILLRRTKLSAVSGLYTAGFMDMKIKL